MYFLSLAHSPAIYSFFPYASSLFVPQTCHVPAHICAYTCIHLHRIFARVAHNTKLTPSVNVHSSPLTHATETMAVPVSP